MTITAKIIADSISPQGIRLTTMQLRYPRFIHAEFMTHRVFSRNASSSRAVPVERLIEDIQRDPAMPIHWGKNQRGMQAQKEHDDSVTILRGNWAGQLIEQEVTPQDAWLHASNRAIQIARAFVEAGYHKQIVNRILEPFSHINVVCTATDYANFYALRRHEDAQPEIKALADAMWEAQQASEPRLLNPGEWHVPYLSDDEIRFAVLTGTTELLIKVSVARCARVSYLTHDGRETTVEEDVALYDRLVGSEPLHASPAEHQATPDTKDWQEGAYLDWENPEEHGNFRGWIQYRKTLPNENVFE